jgi:serine/threonine-protein kinase
MADIAPLLTAALEGRYAIESPLGEGGMATVYLARDLKHDRRVAIKVLKPELAAAIGGERFLAEIRTTAQLQHPHVLGLHDSGDADGLLYFVMPWVEGESLADRLEREKQLPVDEAVTIAEKVAGALQAAHDRGVIHRDIKPANILLQGGEPLVADFGIALAVTSAGGNRLTETGLSLGTPFYMSPEQAAGDGEVDARSDVYALGCVLYEMLVGEPPYTGGTAQVVLARKLTDVPVPPTQARAAVPLNVEGALLKALERLPADRFGRVADFARALADPGFRYGGTGEFAATAGPGLWKGAALVLGLTAVVATSALVAVLLSHDASVPVARYTLGLSSSDPVQTVAGSNVAISPDGSAIVYVGFGGAQSGRQLWLRRRDQLVPSVIANTRRAFGAVFSPDGSRIAFPQEGGLKVSSLGGAPPREILNEGSGVFSAGLTWSEDGYLYFSRQRELWRVPETGGEPEVVVPLDPDQDDATVRWPKALPDGRGVLFSMAEAGPGRDLEASTIVVLDTESGERRPLLQGVRAQYVQSGHVVYVAPDGTLLAAPFDLGSLEVTGDPVAMADGVRVGLDEVHFDVSADGTLVYLAAVSDQRVRPVWASRQGQVQVIDPDWSGRMTYPLLRLTLHEAGGRRAVWAPGGDAVSFFSVRDGSPGVWTKRADGVSRPAELTYDSPAETHEITWSRNGEWLVFRTPAGGGIYAVRPGSDDAPVPVVATDDREFSPTLSPDGRFMAFMSNETGRFEVFVVPFPNAADARWALSTSGGRTPLWSPAGDEIFFLDEDDNMVSVPVETEPTFTHGLPRVLFSAANLAVAEYANHPYDVTADGQRFLMLEPVSANEDQLVVWQGFFEVLEEEVGR